MESAAVYQEIQELVKQVRGIYGTPWRIIQGDLSENIVCRREDKRRYIKWSLRFQIKKAVWEETTTSAALAAGFSMAGKKVLCIDLDPQGNLGFCLGLDTEGGIYYTGCIKRRYIHTKGYQPHRRDRYPSFLILP